MGTNRSRTKHTRRAVLTAAAAAIPVFSQSRTGDNKMDLGNFSVSLAVKDLKASKDFYEKLGFQKVAGDEAHGFVIMKNGEAIIGLFHGMFEKNIMTFNPGWDRNSQKKEGFTDVREIQRQLKARGVTVAKEADASGSGPAAIVVFDPDGNQILIDQHV